MSVSKKMQSSKKSCQVTFSLTDELVQGATSVQVLGDFNEWKPELAPALKKGKNTFSVSVNLEAGSSYQFRYLLDGTTWINDPEADRFVQGPFGAHNSVIDIPFAETTPNVKAASAGKRVAATQNQKTVAKGAVDAAAAKTAKPAGKKAVK